MGAVLMLQLGFVLRSFSAVVDTMKHIKYYDKASITISAADQRGSMDLLLKSMLCTTMNLFGSSLKRCKILSLDHCLSKGRDF